MRRGQINKLGTRLNTLPFTGAFAMLGELLAAAETADRMGDHELASALCDLVVKRMPGGANYAKPYVPCVPPGRPTQADQHSSHFARTRARR